MIKLVMVVCSRQNSDQPGPVGIMYKYEKTIQIPQMPQISGCKIILKDAIPYITLKNVSYDPEIDTYIVVEYRETGRYQYESADVLAREADKFHSFGWDVYFKNSKDRNYTELK